MSAPPSPSCAPATPAPVARAEATAALVRALAALGDDESWRRYLEVQSRFHRYSARNVLLIVAQRPDATRVASYRTWRRLDRHVRRAERAIWIVAPMRPARHDREDEEVATRFRWVPVFDLAQTEGAPLPEPCRRLEGGDGEASYPLLVELAAELGFRVLDHEFDHGTNGDCSHSDRRIRVERRISTAQRVKTLAHELAHVVLHERFEDRALAELEAESVAYVVCAALGIDSSAYSLGYLASWAGGSDAAIDSIERSCTRIQRAAAAILSAAAPDRGR